MKYGLWDDMHKPGPFVRGLFATNAIVVCVWFFQGLRISHAGKEFFPWTLVFDPRSEKEDEFLCIGAERVNQGDTKDESGLLMRYLLNAGQVTAIWGSSPVCAACLNVFCGGQQVLAVQNPTASLGFRKVLIFDADDLTLLHRLPLIPTVNINGITPLYSYNERQMALITWKKFTGSTVCSTGVTSGSEPDCRNSEDEAKIRSREKRARHLCPVQVTLYKLRVDINRVTLQGLTSSAILRCIKPSNIHRLPLPTSMHHLLRDISLF